MDSKMEFYASEIKYIKRHQKTLIHIWDIIALCGFILPLGYAILFLDKESATLKEYLLLLGFICGYILIRLLIAKFVMGEISNPRVLQITGKEETFSFHNSRSYRIYNLFADDVDGEMITLQCSNRYIFYKAIEGDDILVVDCKNSIREFHDFKLMS